MRVTVFGVALLIVGATAAFAQDGNADAKPESSSFMQYHVCLMMPGIFSTYTLDQRLVNCTAAIGSQAYKGEDLSKLYNNRATFQIKKGNPDAALADIETAHELWPEYTLPLINRATIYMARHQTDLALADLNSVVETDPYNYAALTNRASIYVEQGKFNLASEDLDKALSTNGSGDTAWFVRGEIATAYGDYDRAMKDYAHSIDYAPEKPQAYNADCYVRALAKRDLETKALAECNKALEIRPGHASTLDSRGFLYLQLGRYADAIADYDAALAKDPKLAPSLYGRGLAKQKLGDTAGGASDMAAAETITSGIGKTFGTPAIIMWRSPTR